MVFRKKKESSHSNLALDAIVSALQVFRIRICDIFCKVSTYENPG